MDDSKFVIYANALKLFNYVVAKVSLVLCDF